MLWRSSRQRRPARTSSLQAQLASGPNARRCSGPRPAAARSAARPCRRASRRRPPAGGRSASAASARSATAAASSPRRPRTGRPAVQSAYCSGNRSATSARVRPSQRPHAVLAQPGVQAERDAEETGERRRGLDRPAQVAGHDHGVVRRQPRGDQAGRPQRPARGPPRPAGGRAGPGSGPVAFHSVRPCRHSTSRGTASGAGLEVTGRSSPRRPSADPTRGVGVARRRLVSTNGMVGQSFHSRSRA